MKNLWYRLPAWLQALIIGALLFFPSISIIQILMFQNLARNNWLPWSFPFVLVLLWFYWRFATGANKPFKPSKVRMDLSQSALLVDGNIIWILMSIIGLILFTYSVVSVGYAFVDEKTDQFEMINIFLSAPIQTAIPLALALSLTAGIIEELVFRGYIQTILERSYGIFISFFVTAFIFALLHFLPSILLLPYMIVSMAFSYVAYKSRSIIPGVIAHAAFDFIAIMLIFIYPVMVTKEFFEAWLFLNLGLCLVSLLLIWFSQQSTKTTVKAVP